eukprot:gene36532-47589_t
MKFGGHNQDFKFLPMIRGSQDEHFPRIIHIAGVYPNLTPEQLLAPISNPAAPPGAWTYEFADPDGPQLGTVALPGSEIITDCIDPVVVITKNTALGVAVVEEVEMMVVIDRGDRDWSEDNFFIFQTPENELAIQWSDSDYLDDGYEILGRVVLCSVPFTNKMKKKPTGFMEEDDE